MALRLGHHLALSQGRVWLVDFMHGSLHSTMYACYSSMLCVVRSTRLRQLGDLMSGRALTGWQRDSPRVARVDIWDFGMREAFWLGRLCTLGTMYSSISVSSTSGALGLWSSGALERTGALGAALPLASLDSLDRVHAWSRGLKEGPALALERTTRRLEGAPVAQRSMEQGGCAVAGGALPRPALCLCLAVDWLPPERQGAWSRPLHARTHFTVE